MTEIEEQILNNQKVIMESLKVNCITFESELSNEIEATEEVIRRQQYLSGGC